MSNLEKKEVDVSSSGNINSLNSHNIIFKEGDILFLPKGKINRKWEVIEVMEDRLYAVDNDGFGHSFNLIELKEKIFINRKIKQI